MNDTEQLLLKIARCEIAQNLVGKPGISDCCSTVVAQQKASSWAKFQVPEPWSGHLRTARILFLSSNPSISLKEAYPTGSVADAELLDFFERRFDGNWVKDGKFARNNETTRMATGEEYGKSVNYWANIRQRANELIANAVPGIDYALSEVVHCKSIMGAGVDPALATCAGRYLQELLACSGAKVLVLVGKTSLEYWTTLAAQMGLPSVPPTGGTGPHQIAGRQRYCVYLTAPSAGGPKKFEKLLNANQLRNLRQFLA
jgi:hypothetical protein